MSETTEFDNERRSSKSVLSDLLAHIQIAFDKRRYAGATIYRQRMNGRFRVVYRDGHSQPFDYASAKIYANHYEGKVIHKATGYEC